MNIFIHNKKNAIPITIIGKNDLKSYFKKNLSHNNWIKQNQFTAQPGKILIIPDTNGKIEAVLIGESSKDNPYSELFASKLSKSLPANNYYFTNVTTYNHLPYISWAMGCYKYNKTENIQSKLFLPDEIKSDVENTVKSIHFTMDLINHPANILNTDYFAELIKKYFSDKNCKINEIKGEDLLKNNFPLIYEVGKASEHEPRLIDITWGNKNKPKITLIGKGVTFDTGGLDIKPSSGMLLMKKDMGGAANILGLASMIILNKLDVNLRVLIPIVENSISGNSFRPGDILQSRSGLSVEIGNTDAEGRLILADSLSLADEDNPDLIIDMATLTGAARVALGPEIVPFFSTNDIIAQDLQKISNDLQDPVWQMPFFVPYSKWLDNDISDINNSPNTPFAGSIVAAEFLKKFVKKTKNYMHFDVFSWNAGTNPSIPKGGAAQGIRSIYAFIKNHYNLS
jgi:leucyl aminopeptidase